MMDSKRGSGMSRCIVFPFSAIRAIVSGSWVVMVMGPGKIKGVGPFHEPVQGEGSVGGP